jgi:hypothetical protein
MAKITGIIGTRNFELVRNRLLEILIDEFTNQVAISYDDDLAGITFSLEKFITPDFTSIPLINVLFASREKINKQQSSSMSTYVYHVDIYSRSKSTMVAGGDTLSKIKLQKMIGVADAILSNQYYKTLGYEPGFIGSVNCTSLDIGEGITGIDSTSTSIARLVVSVAMSDETQSGSILNITGFDTIVKIGCTNIGHFWSIDQII